MNARDEYRMLARRLQYRGGRKARRAERRIDALVRPMTSLVLRAWKIQHAETMAALERNFGGSLSSFNWTDGGSS